MGIALNTSVINSHLTAQDSEQQADAPAKSFLREQHEDIFPGSRIQRWALHPTWQKPLLSRCRSQIPLAPCQIPGAEVKFSAMSSESKDSEATPRGVG